MNINVLKKEKNITITEKKIKNKTNKKNNISSIIIFFITIFIFSYIIYDYFIINNRVENKIVVVNSKYDSLEKYLQIKLPLIENAIKIQENQLKDLQDFTSAYLLKK